MASYTNFLQRAIKANKERTFFTPYPEYHKFYGEENIPEDERKFKSYLNSFFNEVAYNKNCQWIGDEVSPYTNEKLAIKYPQIDNELLITQSNSQKKDWHKTPIDKKADILIDSIERVKNRFFELAFATMHTTGQSFMMAFQASGPHAMDRALEAIAMGYEELSRFPNHVTWIKPMGKSSIQLKKRYKSIPKGIGLVIGCSTFPVWNSVPGIYANLICGNTVIVKPHPTSILPIAIVISEIQAALKEAGLSENIIQLAVDSINNPITKQLAEHPKTKLIDFTGNSEFGNYLEQLKGKTVFTEKSGVNPVLIDSCESIDEIIDNLAFSVCLYSGQMCTSPQNIFISEKGVRTPNGIIQYNIVVNKLKEAIKKIVENPKIGPSTLASLQSKKTLERVNKMQEKNPILPSKSFINDAFPSARVCTPTIIEINEQELKKAEEEQFGPIIFIVKTKSFEGSLQYIKELALKKGVLSCLAHCIDDDRKPKIEETLEESFVPISFNLKGFFWVNQNAAFSDFHGTGGTPAGNASFTNPNFVNQRFVWVGHREME